MESSSSEGISFCWWLPILNLGGQKKRWLKMDFTDKIRLRGKAEEDLFFAKLDRELIQAMHEKQQHQEELLKSAEQDDPNSATSLNSK